MVLAAEPDEIPLAIPVPSLPYPGFWWSVFWCFCYLALLHGGSFGLGIVWAAAKMLMADDPSAFQSRLRTEGVQALDLENILLPFQAVAGVFMLAFVLLIVRLFVGRNWQRRLGLRRPELLQLFLAVLGLPGLIYISSGVYAATKQLLPTFGSQEAIVALLRPWPWGLGVLAIGLLPGVGEELWCRGFLGRGLVGRYGYVIGVGMTSLFFGIMHVDPPQVVATAVMGVFLHFSYLTTRSLWVPMLLHFLNNSAAVLETKISAFRGFDELEGKTAIPVYAAALALWGAVSWALYSSRPYLRTVNEGEQQSWRPEFPGVEHPPSGCGTVLVHPRPDWLAATLVVILFTGFVLMISYYMNAS
jgi:membrane protease YdiL (CAAX protease family)